MDAELEINAECTYICVSNKSDILSCFTSKLSDLVCKTELVTSNTIPQIKRNIGKLLSELKIPLSELFCKMFHQLENLSLSKKDRLAVFIKEIISMSTTGECNPVIYEDKRAKRNLFMYLNTTSSYFCFQAVVESLFVMFKHGMNLKRILPEQISFIIDVFANAPEKPDINQYHDFMGEVSRRLITEVIGRKNIDFRKLTKKVFKARGRSKEILDDSFLYIEKLNSRICHFVKLGNNEMYLEPIQKSDNVKVIKASNIISTDKWDFHMVTDVDSTVEEEEPSAKVADDEAEIQKV